MLTLIVLIWVNDIFAYLSGKIIGRHPLSSSISPGKTIEGFIGGLTFSILSAYIISMFMDNASTLNWMIIGASVSITATIGDLFESKLKREAGVKDSGSIFPGHGGMLDRFDSLLFSAPVFLFLHLIF
jgi:phosphatidate cytidylyltransferase